MERNDALQSSSYDDSARDSEGLSLQREIVYPTEVESPLQATPAKPASLTDGILSGQRMRDLESLELPDELVENVMVYACDEIEVKSLEESSLVSGWSMRAVCKQWRAVFTDSRRLWSTWRIRITGEAHPSSDKRKDRMEHLQTLLWQTSPSLPLYIEFLCDNIIPCRGECSEFLTSLIVELLGQSRRFKSFSFINNEANLDFPLELQEKFDRLLRHGLPESRSLTLINYPKDPESEEDLLVNSPSLRSAEIQRGHPGGSGIFIPAEIELPWGQLECLTLHIFPSLEDVACLSQCTSLRVLSVSHIWPVVGYNIGNIPSFHFSQLEELVICPPPGFLVGHNRMTIPFATFTCPKLRLLEIKSLEPTRYKDTMQWDPAGFLDFLAQSQCTIQRLRFASTKLNVPLDVILSALPYLESLHIEDLCYKEEMDLLLTGALFDALNASSPEVLLLRLKDLTLDFAVRGRNQTAMLEMVRLRCGSGGLQRTANLQALTINMSKPRRYNSGSLSQSVYDSLLLLQGQGLELNVRQALLPSPGHKSSYSTNQAF